MNDQIAAEAVEQLQPQGEFQRGQWLAIIKSAIRKAIDEANQNDHDLKQCEAEVRELRNQLRAHASEQKDTLELAYHRGYDAGWEAHRARADEMRAHASERGILTHDGKRDAMSPLHEAAQASDFQPDPDSFVPIEDQRELAARASEPLQHDSPSVEPQLSASIKNAVNAFNTDADNELTKRDWNRLYAIIQDAIEKARKLQMDEDDAMWSAKLETESRAAHGTSAVADASEPLRDSPEYRDQLRSNPRTCHLTHGKPSHASERWTVTDHDNSNYVHLFITDELRPLFPANCKPQLLKIADAHNATLAQRPTPATDDTKRLDEVLKVCAEVNRTVKQGNFYLPETREGIDATLSQTKEGK